ncbi:unnamed protein product [Ixodes pacificus]
MSGKAKFTIDDAFEDEGDDAVRSYGSTTESSALKGGTREECLVVRVEDDRTRRLRLPEDTLSKDSDSLIQCDGRKYDAKDGCWWKHPKVRDNWRVMLAALGLLVVGLGKLSSSRGAFEERVPISHPGLLVTGIVVQVLPQIGKHVRTGTVSCHAGICHRYGARNALPTGVIFCRPRIKSGSQVANKWCHRRTMPSNVAILAVGRKGFGEKGKRMPVSTRRLPYAVGICHMHLRCRATARITTGNGVTSWGGSPDHI